MVRGIPQDRSLRKGRVMDPMLPSEIDIWNAAYAAAYARQCRDYHELRDGSEPVRGVNANWSVMIADFAVLALREYRKAHGPSVGVLLREGTG